MKQTKKMLHTLCVLLVVLSMILMPMANAVHAEGEAGSPNYDVVLTAVTPEVDSGNTGLLKLNVKIAGSQESINEELSGTALVTVQFPENTEYYTLNKDNLESLAILGATPTYDEAGRILRWALKDVETGVSAEVHIPVNTHNGITPNNTVLGFTANLTKADGTALAGLSNAKFNIKAEYVESVSKKYKGIVGSTAEAPKKGQSVIWTLKGAVNLAERKGMYMKPGSKITVKDTLPAGLKYINSGIISDSLNMSDAVVNGQTITWTLVAPSLDEQKAAAEHGAALYAFEIELITEVTLETAKIAKLDNKVSFTTTNIVGEDVTKEATALVTVVPDGDPVVGENGSWYPSVTGGPTNGEGKYILVGNPNPAVGDAATLGFHALYCIALNNNEDILTNNGVDARSEWKPQEVLKQGYNKIVSKQTFSEELIFSGVRLEVPKSYYHSSQQGKRLAVDPVTTIKLHLKDGQVKEYRVEFDKDKEIHQILFSRKTVGLTDEDQVLSYEIEYKNADGSPIFGGVALDTFPLFNIKKGYEGELTWQNKWEMTLANGKTYIKSAEKKTDKIGPRTVSVVQPENKVPAIRTGVRFNKTDGNIVGIGDNSVRHFVNSPFSSPVSINGEVSSAILLPYGVKLKGDGKFQFWHQEFRLNTAADIITGKGEVIDNDYEGTGKQLVKLVWDKDTIYPYDQLTAEFDVEVTKDATKSMELVSYTASTGSQDIVASDPNYNLVETDTNDINKDGISAPQKWIRARNSYNLRSKEDLRIEKFVKGSLDSDFSRFGKASLGGDIEYKVNLTNTTGRNISTLGFVDVLPSVGDLGIVDNTNRGSAFTPLLKGPINLPAEWADKVDVYYSTSKNPKRTDLYSKVDYSAGAFKHVDPAGAEEPNWTQDVEDWSSVHSFKLELKAGTIWVKGQDISLNFTMKAPEKGDAVNLPDEGILFTDINAVNRTEDNERKAAWNSFAVTTNGLLPTEPERVGVVLFKNGGAVRVKYFIEGTDIELDNPTAGDRVPAGDTDEGWYTVKKPDTKIGEEYQTDNKILKPMYLKDKNGKTYKLTAKEIREDSDPKDGSVKPNTQYIIYEYKLVDEPDKPTPDEPDKPTPDKPDKPTPDKPDKPTPDKPDKPTPDEPGKPTPDKPDKPTPDKPEKPTPNEPNQPTPNEPNQPNPSDSGDTPKNAPKTGDASPLWSYAMLMGISALLVSVTIIKRRKPSRI
ncbi:MAG: hypothetical protein PUH12_04715 [Lachnospiraceae bacterium]|nr:hypothetical protein [Lachnospiraceae bacterium]